MAKAGRPTTYKPDLIPILRQYLDNCPNVVPTVQGFSLVCNRPAKRIREWKCLDIKKLNRHKWPKFKIFRDMLDELEDRQFVIALEKSAKREIDGKIGSLILYQHGLTDKMDITTGGESIKPQVVMYGQVENEGE